MADDLTDDERKLLINVLAVEIEGSKFPLSPRIVALKAIRAKLRGETVEGSEPSPAATLNTQLPTPFTISDDDVRAKAKHESLSRALGSRRVPPSLKSRKGRDFSVGMPPKKYAQRRQGVTHR
jgi:hypothetical protein